MKKLITLLLPILGVLLLLPTTLAKNEAVVLNDENFEEMTHAAKGGDTGDWLILFCEMERF